MRLPFRRHLSVLFSLLYLLVVGAETVQHAWAEPAAGVPEAHVHGESGDHDCPPPPHDELHCPACKLGGARDLPASPSALRAAAPSPARIPAAREERAPSPRSHAPPTSRAPPLG